MLSVTRPVLHGRTICTAFPLTVLSGGISTAPMIPGRGFRVQTSRHGNNQACCPLPRAYSTLKEVNAFLAGHPASSSELSSEILSESHPTENPAEPPWIDTLEKSAQGPWLSMVMPDETIRLQIAHGLLYQVLLYLNRPKTTKGEEEGAQYLAVFQTARVPDHSEVARARRAIASITRAVVTQILTISKDSPLRAPPGNGEASSSNDIAPKPYQIFITATVLAKINMKHMKLVAGEIRGPEDFSAWWEETRPVLIELFERLEDGGFDLGKERDTAEV